jgi:hypothetical protein
MRFPSAVFVALVLLTPSLGSAYDQVPVVNGGAVVGRVRYAGRPPAPKKITPTVNKVVCGRHGPIVSGELVVSPDSGLQHAVIYVVDVTVGKPLISMPTRSLDQNGCTFQPHVLVIPVGRPLKVLNSDGILHNIHTYSAKNPPINSAQPGSMPEVSLGPFTIPEVIKVRCDVHGWMSCWVWVASQPYVTVSGPGGAYKIPDLLPGKYRVEAWHETLGNISSAVTIAAGKESRLDFIFPARPAKAQPAGTK